MPRGVINTRPERMLISGRGQGGRKQRNYQIPRRHAAKNVNKLHRKAMCAPQPRPAEARYAHLRSLHRANTTVHTACTACAACAACIPTQTRSEPVRIPTLLYKYAVSRRLLDELVERYIVTPTGGGSKHCPSAILTYAQVHHI